MSNQVLIFYGTSYGQTAKVADVIGDYLTNHGVEVVLVDGDSPPPILWVGDFDGVIVGASVIFGRHQRSVRRFVRDNHEALNALPSAFFSVSGSASSGDERGQRHARKSIDEFLRETGWHPTLSESVAGAMAYRKYNPFIRWMMKRIAKRNGEPTDTSRDHELTDWAQVERFAESFVNALYSGKEAHSSV